MKKITLNKFKQIYLEEVKNVIKYLTPEIQEKIAKHNYGWRGEGMSFESYLNASVTRFYIAYEGIFEINARSVCDIGGFWGVFPITLKRLGVPIVAMTEALEYYDSAFSHLFDYIKSKGVDIIDFDPFTQETSINQKFDFVMALAVIEHYPHSLKIFMKNFNEFMGEGSYGYLEVPNIAYFEKRMHLLLGKSPLVNVKDIYLSCTPFTGHHHEFTMDELETLINLSGGQVISKNQYNYSIPNKLYYKIRFPFHHLATILFKNTRECLSILFKRRFTS